MKKFIAFLLVSSFILTMSVPAYANVSDLQKKREDVKQEQDSTREKLENTTEKKNEAWYEVETVDAELNQVTEELEQINQNLDDVQELLVKTDAELKDAEIKKEEQDSTFKKRARYMYMYGKIGYLSIVLEARSFADLLNRFEYINRIAEYDRNLVVELQATEDLIAQKLDETEKQRREIQVLSNQQTAKMQNLEYALEQKRSVYVALASDEKYFEQHLEDLQASDKKIEEMIKKAQAEQAAAEAAAAAAQAKKLTASQAVSTASNRTSATPSGGSMSWPVPGNGRVSSGYGYRTNPLSGRSEFHTGVDIPAPNGTSIISPKSGVVVYAGSGIRGYGNSMVVDHGGGISTFYGHCSRLVAGNGQSVNSGQVIAKVGSTGYSTGPHLHFEVRVNGANTNPLKYTGS